MGTESQKEQQEQQADKAQAEQSTQKQVRWRVEKDVLEKLQEMAGAEPASKVRLMEGFVREGWFQWDAQRRQALKREMKEEVREEVRKELQKEMAQAQRKQPAVASSPPASGQDKPPRAGFVLPPPAGMPPATVAQGEQPVQASAQVESAQVEKEAEPESTDLEKELGLAPLEERIAKFHEKRDKRI